jgi:hypothetical protein
MNEEWIELINDVLKAKYKLQGSANALAFNEVNPSAVREALTITDRLLSLATQEEFNMEAINFLIGIIDVTSIEGALNRNILLQHHLNSHAEFVNSFRVSCAAEKGTSILGKMQICLNDFLSSIKCCGSIDVKVSSSSLGDSIPWPNEPRIDNDIIFRTYPSVYTGKEKFIGEMDSFGNKRLSFDHDHDSACT